MNWNSKVVNDFTEMSVVDGDQKMSFRVGPVFFKRQAKNNGLWIEYTCEGKLYGPILMTRKNWIQIRDYINKRFAYTWRK